MKEKFLLFGALLLLVGAGCGVSSEPSVQIEINDADFDSTVEQNEPTSYIESSSEVGNTNSTEQGSTASVTISE